MSNKQSSIEWLISQLQKSKDWHRVLNELSQMNSARVDILEQAKAMHMEEVINSILDNRNITSQVTFKDAEQYYNETFEQ